MMHTPDALPDDPQELRRLAEQMARQLAVYEQQHREKDERIEQLLDYIQLLRQKRFGTKADRLSKDQLNLFDEVELADAQQAHPRHHRPPRAPQSASRCRLTWHGSSASSTSTKNRGPRWARAGC